MRAAAVIAVSFVVGVVLGGAAFVVGSTRACARLEEPLVLAMSEANDTHLPKGLKIGVTATGAEVQELRFARELPPRVSTYQCGPGGPQPLIGGLL